MKTQNTLRDSIMICFTFGMTLVYSCSAAAHSFGPEVTDDLFDRSSGVLITSHSPLSSIPTLNEITDIIGASSEYVHFADFSGTGFEHFVEFETPEPVTIRSIGLKAEHDKPPRDYFARGFSEFQLWADGIEVLTFETANPYVDTLNPANGVLLPTGKDYRLHIRLNLLVPTTAQHWRAVFVQPGNSYYGHANGPRVLELDGYAATIPEPSTMLLVGVLVIGKLMHRRI